MKPQALFLAAGVAAIVGLYVAGHVTAKSGSSGSSCACGVLAVPRVAQDAVDVPAPKTTTAAAANGDGPDGGSCPAAGARKASSTKDPSPRERSKASVAAGRCGCGGRR